ncbi:MAG: tRNA 2-thiouridine(34) synthase MnmA [Nitrospirae bacterium]|nr:tRNA 2-thiouridine(34) synthase MnmA [Nitrospirota bacterium]
MHREIISMKTVIVGMSGGVDSSVTAHILKEQGLDVKGVSFILYEARLKNTFTGCCSIESVNNAADTARRLGVSHRIVDLREAFLENVIEPFIDAYSKGVTPNPCILCNRYIKFPFLLKIAKEEGADYIATGHYARVENEDKIFLKKAADDKKDQSYVLYMLKEDEIRRLKLPLGYMGKSEVRGIAEALNLPAAQRPESQEICFVEDKNYFKFLENLTDAREGTIVDIETGKILGRHKGLHLFTLGQRKRLGIATGKPLYVSKIDYRKNIVYVGSSESAMAAEFRVGDLNWLINSEELCLPHVFRATVKVRSTMRDMPAVVEIIDADKVKVIFDEPQWAPAPGQSAVFYNGDVVIGGGVILNNAAYGGVDG